MKRYIVDYSNNVKGKFHQTDIQVLLIVHIQFFFFCIPLNLRVYINLRRRITEDEKNNLTC